MGYEKILLVGDNPFHGVSHLSQNRARERSQDITNPEYCAHLIKITAENGADGFMFSVSETTLDIIKSLSQMDVSLNLYAIAPAASDYVRLASRLGTPGMAIHLATQILKSGNPKAIISGIKGVLLQDPVSLMKAFLYYEIYRVRAVLKNKEDFYCFLLHELVTEMTLALNMDWLFPAFIDFMRHLKIKPGFETRNSPLLIDRLLKIGIDLSQIVIVAPYNKAGFQMSPSKEECEKALLKVSDTEVIAMSILASGFLKLSDGMDYISKLPQLKGIVVGVSKEQHARDFKILREILENK
jgi:hypothetical protein